MQLTGLRNPYPGRLGVVEEGALADLLLVDGNPLEDIDLIADPATNFRVIMKDGTVYKNSLRGRLNGRLAGLYGPGALGAPNITDGSHSTSCGNSKTSSTAATWQSTKGMMPL